MSSLISARLISDTIRAITVDLVPPAFTRLEPQSVSGDPAPGLEARIHDPLWMLARQWQLGEFHGEDSGTPIAVHVSTESSNPTQWQPGDPAPKLPTQPLSADAILDALVEREPGHPEGPGLRLRAESGAQLLDDLADAGVTGVRDALISAFPLAPPAPVDPFDLQAPRLATLLTGMVPDAESVARNLEGVGGATPPWIAGASNPATASNIAAAWLAWYRGGVSPLPDPNADSWIDDRLEYRFGVTLDRADQPALRAPSFNGGRVDWYAFNSDVNPPEPSPNAPNAAPPVATPMRRDIDLVATPLRFAGMPSDRYWQYEDGAVNLGMLQSQPHDLARLCLVEFAMVYGNDWLVVPVDIPANAFTTITDVSYTTTFGERISVPSPDDSGRSGKFQMFSITPSGGKALPGIFLPPSGQSPQEGQPLEEVLFLRDEAAAMSWAVERFVQGPSGDPRNRGDEPRPAPILPSTDPGAELDYILATQVPDNWIPLVTIALGQNAIALRKGAMVKAGAPVLARGVLLRPTPLTIQDQEVPREGVRVRRIPVLARHADGSYERWIGRRVLVGRGEASSGLLFDSAIRRNAPPVTQSVTDTETSVAAPAPAPGQVRLRLKAFRFRYDAVLEACLNGEHRILVQNPAGPFESGRHIRKIQQALIDLGYSLPIHGADSTYGPETATAVSQFKTDQKISPNDGVVGPQTMAALDAIFVDEPSPFSPPAFRPGDILLDDFIEALQDAASANAADTDAQFLTRLRQLYYPGTDPDDLSFREVAFDRLLPDAPFKFADGSRRILTPAGMNPLFFARLAQHAPENPTPAKPLDNPSPYLIDATGARVDIGHMLLTLDALLHPRAASPYSDFGIPAIDPASWVADVGIAAVWTEQNGVPDAPRVLPPLVPSGDPDFDGYFAMSAPDPDLLGDIDGFNIASSWLAGQSLSSAIIRYYVDGDTAPGVYRQRFRTFMTTLFGTFDPDAPTLTSSLAFWTSRVDRFNDLFSIGATGAFLTLTPPPRRIWKFSTDALAKFFQWLIDGERIESGRFD